MTETKSNEPTYQTATFQNTKDIAIMRKDLEYITKSIDQLSRGFSDLDKKIDDRYVTRDELDKTLTPMKNDIKNISGGVNKVVWIVLTAVIVAIIGLVIRPQLPF